MLVYGGIDEAGYGPMLGPLCVGLTVFEIDDHDPAAGAPNLWKLLRRAVCRRRRDSRRRIAVDDSKKLKGSAGGAGHPLQHLERGVLAFASTIDELPASDDDLLGRLLPHVPREPWYATSTPIPLAVNASELRIAAARLQRALAAAGVRCTLMRGEAIDARTFNKQVGQTGNKAAVNFQAAMRLVDAAWRARPDAHPRIVLDRHGGRTQYRQPLAQFYPDAALRIVAETPALSRYRLTRGGSCLTVTFLAEAESGHFPVALASMLAKYVRELMMLRLNRFFTGHVPQLKPTAGYVADARRYISDIEPVIRRLDLPRDALVRQR